MAVFFAGNFCEMSSFQETVALNLGKEQGSDFVAFNRKHFSRIYPKGTRTDSSNYDPIPYWNMGCQLGKKGFFLLVFLLIRIKHDIIMSQISQ